MGGFHYSFGVLHTNTMKYLTFVAVGLAFVSMALAMPYPMPYPMPYALPDDAYAPAPAYHAPALGRVKIQAYRGPSKGDGYDAFAPWGFYVTQPKDDFKGYSYH